MSRPFGPVTAIPADASSCIDCTKASANTIVQWHGLVASGLNLTARGLSLGVRHGRRATHRRWRLALAEGEARYDAVEKRIVASPNITVPTITLEGDANGAPHSEPAAYEMKFFGRYTCRTINGGVVPNLPQEAPQAFAQAIRNVERALRISGSWPHNHGA